ncbi:tRNA (adenosine(37)-N6)-threonylcarbamoyltransferase complex ATPase subunit type 1 TsaE [Patescibacteria group bacterium]
MQTYSTIVNTEKHTEKIACKIANLVSGGEIILLEGDLGGGKTTFTKAFAKALGVNDTVTSPTFVIKKNYLTKDNLHIEHLDLYRINQEEIIGDPTLFENLGQNNTIGVIEWGEKIQKSLDHYLLIKFTYLDKDKRKLELSAIGRKEIKILSSICDDFNN